MESSNDIECVFIFSRKEKIAIVFFFIFIIIIFLFFIPYLHHFFLCLFTFFSFGITIATESARRISQHPKA